MLTALIVARTYRNAHATQSKNTNGLFTRVELSCTARGQATEAQRVVLDLPH
jgi:hypothetical protein